MTPGQARIRRWRASPQLFARECLNLEPDAWQLEVLEAAGRRSRIAMKASKGVGKTAVLGILGWWFLACFKHPKVICTSISGDNLKDGLWAELAKMQARSELLKSAFTWNSERITCNDHPKTWFASARTWPKSADAAAQADTLAGIHAEDVLFLVDEVGGIPDAVLAAAEAGLANADEAKGYTAKLVIAGNPTHLSGPLYRASTRERHLWYVREISGDPDDPKRAPRVSVQWAREQIEKFGRDNPWVLVNVFGQFPPGQSNALIGVEEAQAATRAKVSPLEYQHEARVLGVDVARYGDDRTVIFPRQGRVALKPKVLRNLGAVDVAGEVAEVIKRWKPHAVFIDAVGVGGPVVDLLQRWGFQVTGVEAGGRATKPRLMNMRAQMWSSMAEAIRKGLSLPDDPELVSELTGPTYWYRADGKLQLESKDDMKDRGLASPDLADALALTFAYEVPEPDASSIDVSKLPGRTPRILREDDLRRDA